MNSIHFGNAAYLWLIGLIPLTWLLFMISERRRSKKLAAFASVSLQQELIPSLDQINRQQRHRSQLTLLVIILLIFAALRPQWGYEWETRTQRGVDIAIALDVSESMLAKDIAPSRLERARWEISDLLNKLQGDRVALIAFAGVAFIESPLTVDYGTFRSFLKTLSPELIPYQGTNIESALDKSLEALLGKEKKSLPDGGAIVLITDGESFDGDVALAANRAKEANIRIYVMGIGTADGAPIELPRGGYKKDKAGHVIITKLNQLALEQLALDTGGRYISSITSSDDTVALYEKGIRQQLEVVALGDVRIKRWNEYYQIPLLAALVLLLTPPLVTAFRRRFLSLTTGLALCIIAPSYAHAETAERIGADATKEFHSGAFSSALSEFSRGAREAPEDPRFLLGKGASHYRLQQFEDAKTAYQLVAKTATLPAEKAAALYNAANSMVQLNELDDAIKTYEESLKLIPNDKEAQDNLAYAKRLKQQKQQSSSSSKSNSSSSSSSQSSSESSQQSTSQASSSENSSDSKSSQSSSSQSSSQDSSSSPNSSSDSSASQISSEQNSAQSPSSGKSSESSQSSSDQQPSASSSSSQDSTQGGNEGQSSDSQSNDQESSSTRNSSKESSSDSSGSDSSGDATAPIEEDPSDHEKQQNLNNEQIEALLGNIEEDREALAEHRRKVAKGELQRAQRLPPERDW